MGLLRQATFAAAYVASGGALHAGQAPAPSTCVAAKDDRPDPIRVQWLAGNDWRYGNADQADLAYRRLKGCESPWPEWHQEQVVTLPAGLRFEMAVAPGQPVDRPGAFGTFDHIPDVSYVRRTLAVKTKWKPKVDRVVTYEITEPVPADTGVIGPQIDVEGGAYLPGGGSQLQMKVPATERMRHLKVVGTPRQIQ